MLALTVRIRVRIRGTSRMCFKLSGSSPTSSALPGSRRNSMVSLNQWAFWRYLIDLQWLPRQEWDEETKFWANVVLELIGKCSLFQIRKVPPLLSPWIEHSDDLLWQRFANFGEYWHPLEDILPFWLEEDEIHYKLNWVMLLTAKGVDWSSNWFTIELDNKNVIRPPAARTSTVIIEFGNTIWMLSKSIIDWMRNCFSVGDNGGIEVMFNDQSFCFADSILKSEFFMTVTS